MCARAAAWDARFASASLAPWLATAAALPDAASPIWPTISATPAQPCPRRPLVLVLQAPGGPTDHGHVAGRARGAGCQLRPVVRAGCAKGGPRACQGMRASGGTRESCPCWPASAATLPAVSRVPALEISRASAGSGCSPRTATLCTWCCPASGSASSCAPPTAAVASGSRAAAAAAATTSGRRLEGHAGLRAALKLARSPSANRSLPNGRQSYTGWQCEALRGQPALMPALGHGGSVRRAARAALAALPSSLRSLHSALECCHSCRGVSNARTEAGCGSAVGVAGCRRAGRWRGLGRQGTEARVQSAGQCIKIYERSQERRGGAVRP